MKTAVLAVRLILGLAFVLFGLEYFVHFLPFTPPKPTPAAGALMSALYPSGYLTAVKVLEVAGGALLLSGLLVPLGLVLLTPVIVNIAFYDIFLMQQPGLGEFLFALAVFLIWAYRPYFIALFTIHARPAAWAGVERGAAVSENGVARSGRKVGAL